MQRLVREGMEQGAVGLSSGLDYVPSIYADEDELTDSVRGDRPVRRRLRHAHARLQRRRRRPPRWKKCSTSASAPAAASTSRTSTASPTRRSRCSTPPARDGVDVTFDLYCYLYGSTIVAMLTLPPEVLRRRHRRDPRAAEEPGGAEGTRSRRSPTRGSPSRRSASRACRSDEYRHTTKGRRSPPRRRRRDQSRRRLHLRPAHRHEPRGRVRDPPLRGAAGIGHPRS